MSDEEVKEMASLLRNGATMLDKYCPQCNGILFRLRNQKIFCPKCQREVVIVNKDQKIPSEENMKTGEKNQSSEAKKKTAQKPSSLEIEDSFLNALGKLSDKLNNTEDMILIEKILDNIDKLLNIISKIRNL